MEEERKRKTAVALRYEKDKESAPQITATGKGVIAEKIIEIAKEYNIPIHEDPELVSLLAKLNLGELIPSSTYQVVAEILAWVYSLNKQRESPINPKSKYYQIQNKSKIQMPN